AAGRQAGDRDRHVRAQSEQLSALVEEAVRAGSPALVAPRQNLLVLEGRRRHLAVAMAFEDLRQGLLESAKLAHLVREDVPGSGWDRMDRHEALQSTGRSSGSRK